MAVSLDTGIEGISYQSQSAASKSDFPQRKEYLPISASIPSHLEEVFNLYAHAQTLENTVAPRIPNKYVTSPSNYLRLFEEVDSIVTNYVPGSEQEKKVVQAAQTLFSVMREDFSAFNIGRSTLILG